MDACAPMLAAWPTTARFVSKLSCTFWCYGQGSSVRNRTYANGETVYERSGSSQSEPKHSNKRVDQQMNHKRHPLSEQVSGGRAPRPCTLDQWENEGGSTCAFATRNHAATKGFAAYSGPGVELLEALPHGVVISNKHGEILYANPAFRILCSISESELLGRHWSQLIDGQDIVPRVQEVKRDDPALVFEARLMTTTGLQPWTRHSVVSLDSRRVPQGHLHSIEEINASKLAEQAAKLAQEVLLRECERARVTLECIGDAVISTDANGKVTYLNAVAEELTGWSREAAVGEVFSRVFQVLDADTGKRAKNPAERAMERREIVQIPANCLLLRPDGSELAIEDSAAPILDADGQLTGAVVIFRDRKMSRENTARMAHLARHDALTDLPNRVAFAEHFNQAINLAQRHGKKIGLLFIDIDGFKQTNDNLGHSAGDCLLKALSRELTSCVRSTDLVCRHGGDEFLVMLNGINQAADAGNVASKIRAAAASPVQLEGLAIGLELSIGISLYPEDGTDLESMLHKADTAMYQAKLDQVSGYRFYQAGMNKPPAFDTERKEPPQQ